MPEKQTSEKPATEKTEVSYVVIRFTKSGVETKISKSVGNQIIALREKVEQMKKAPELAEAATESVAALTKLMNFVDLT